MDLCFIDFIFSGTYNLIINNVRYDQVQMEFYLSRFVSYVFLLIIGFRTVVLPFQIYKKGLEGQSEIVKESIFERIKIKAALNIPEVRILNPLFKAKLFIIVFSVVIWQNLPWACLGSIIAVNSLHIGFEIGVWSKFKPFRSKLDFISAALFELVIILFLVICIIIEFTNEDDSSMAVILQEITALIAIVSIIVEFLRFLMIAGKTFYLMIKARKLNVTDIKLKEYKISVRKTHLNQMTVAPLISNIPLLRRRIISQAQSINSSRNRRSLLEVLKEKRISGEMTLHKMRKEVSILV